MLYHRYKAGKKGIIMLACELIDNNGKELLKCVNQYIDQWGLEDGFKKYVNEDCTFCGSLVDRIVPGRIRDPKEVAELEEKHGYADPLLDVGEVFGVWVIEGDTKLNDILPFRKAGLEDHVFVTPDMSPYKKRKVRILNGAHTGLCAGRLSGRFCTSSVTACTTPPFWATLNRCCWTRSCPSCRWIRRTASSSPPLCRTVSTTRLSTMS